MRKPHITKCKSFESLNRTSSMSPLSCDEILGKSLDLSAHCPVYISKIEAEIKEMKITLSSTQNELDNVILENIELKKQISSMSQELELLKQLCRSPLGTFRRNISSSTKKSVRRRLAESFRDTSSQDSPAKQSMDHEKDLEIEPEEESQPKDIIQDDIINKKPEKSLNQEENKTKKYYNNTMPMRRSIPKKCDKNGNNICIISSQKQRILSHKMLTKTNFLSNNNICHYRKPACGIKNLMEGIDKKLTKFTKDDYCIIFLGEEDFVTTNNYLELVVCLREHLQPLHHTNIILCLPTFKCHKYAAMFNWRVESFNNLLYLDNESKLYATLLDSNVNLTYDYRMFSRQHGDVNKNGFLVILRDLKALIKYLAEECIEPSLNTEHQANDDMQLFLG